MYSAESVIGALKANGQLLCEGIDKIGCPSHIDLCERQPDICNIGMEQNCKQPISIHHEYKKLSVLIFRFMVSEKNHSGFIRMDDSALKRLIQHKFIDKNMLKPVKDVA